jgi:alanine-synthesizing transaminase
MFPRFDPNVYTIKNDVDLVMDILAKEKILVVQGSAFNIKDTQHLRIVFLPQKDELAIAITKIGEVMQDYRN